VTCSLEPEENEHVVEEILSKYPDLRRADLELPLHVSDARHAGKEFFRLWPPDDQTDGFFMAVIKKLG